eukprot:PITA_26068
MTVNTPLFWSLYFDGSKSSEGLGAGCILVSPHGEKTMLSCRLEFECTNNIAEYEALVQGLYKAIDLKVQYLKVFDDSEIIVKQSYDNQIIEEDEHDSQIKETPQENAIPKPVVKLEDLYDIKDRFKLVTNTKIQSSTLRITQKASIGTSPFNLVYGKEAILPTNLVLPSLALVQFIEEAPSSSIQLRYDQILKLEEEREKAKDTHAKHQKIIKATFDSVSSGSKQFQVGDLVLKWDKAHEDKGKHTKFQKLWLGPFHICEKVGHSTFILQDLVGLRDSLPVNGLVLRKFFN